ncbi:MAG: nuclear transport factor 2 family protein [Pseudomonadota bacterium]
MTTQEIAQKLCEHMANQTERQALDELYSADAVSVEAMTPPGVDPVSRGSDAIRAKHDWWDGAMEVHDFAMEGPFLNGDQFSMIFNMDCTDKSSGQRWQAKEVALYEVENGKIARESFFMMPME